MGLHGRFESNMTLHMVLTCVCPWVHTARACVLCGPPRWHRGITLSLRLRQGRCVALHSGARMVPPHHDEVSVCCVRVLLRPSACDAWGQETGAVVAAEVDAGEGPSSALGDALLVVDREMQEVRHRICFHAPTPTLTHIGPWTVVCTGGGGRKVEKELELVQRKTQILARLRDAILEASDGPVEHTSAHTSALESAVQKVCVHAQCLCPAARA